MRWPRRKRFDVVIVGVELGKVWRTPFTYSRRDEAQAWCDDANANPGIVSVFDDEGRLIPTRYEVRQR